MKQFLSILLLFFAIAITTFQNVVKESPPPQIDYCIVDAPMLPNPALFMNKAQLEKHERPMQLAALFLLTNTVTVKKYSELGNSKASWGLNNQNDNFEKHYSELGNSKAYLC